jgi:hypothetical protein
LYNRQIRNIMYIYRTNYIYRCFKMTRSETLLIY